MQSAVAGVHQMPLPCAWTAGRRVPSNNGGPHRSASRSRPYRRPSMKPPSRLCVRFVTIHDRHRLASSWMPNGPHRGGKRHACTPCIAARCCKPRTKLFSIEFGAGRSCAMTRAMLLRHCFQSRTTLLGSTCRPFSKSTPRTHSRVCCRGEIEAEGRGYCWPP